MIFTLILNFFFLLITGLVGLLPTGNLPAVIGTSFTYIVSIANEFTYVIPIPTLLEALGVVVVFDTAILVWHFVNWIIRKIPGMQ